MTLSHFILTAALALVPIGAANAGEIQPMAGQSIDLGEMSGTLYYTAKPDGFHVVTTLAQGEAGTPVRFETVLAPEQSVTISTPREAGHRTAFRRNQPTRQSCAASDDGEHELIRARRPSMHARLAGPSTW